MYWCQSTRGSVKRCAKRSTVLRALMNEQLRRAVLAFPDEDVLVGTRMISADAFEAYKALNDVVPRPGHKASGEDRAWGRRLAKRFGADLDNYDDRTFVAVGDGTPSLVLDYESLKPQDRHAEVAAQFDLLDRDRGDVLIGFGWAMAEDLERLN